ncbi:MAG: glycosyltransferase family 4 protein [Patescibacteria group bacterium]|nr:glycosyltransferase family 4 protein [Patescibacteria group bacterium]
MKILILLQFPLFGAGAGTYTRKLAEFLAKNSQNKVAVACVDAKPIKGCKMYNLKPSSRAVFVSNPGWTNAPRFSTLPSSKINSIYQSYLKQIITVVEEFKPDIIHANHICFMSWAASYIKALYKIGYVITCHGSDVENATMDRRFVPLGRDALSRADSIIDVSGHTKKWMLKVFGRRLARKTRVIPGGIDVSNYLKPIPTQKIEKKYHLDNKKIIIFVGRLIANKGVDYLIKAANKIKGEIYIFGSGSEKENLVKYAKARKAKNVHFMGYFGKEYIDELRQFYRRANVVVVPSVWDEPLGLVVLEAMVCGTPVVATKKGGIPLAIKDNYNGLLIRARSAKAISYAVNKILKDPILADKLGANALQTVDEKFDWRDLAKKIEDIYIKVIEKNSLEKQVRFPAGLTQRDIDREKRELKKKLGHI